MSGPVRVVGAGIGTMGKEGSEMIRELRLIPGTKLQEVVVRSRDDQTQLARSPHLGGWGRSMCLGGPQNWLFRNECMPLQGRLKNSAIATANPAQNYVGGKDLIGNKDYPGSDLGGSDFMLFNCKG